MKILKITAENFLGIRKMPYEFSSRTRIRGRNGSGKSSIASAYFWVFSDKNYALSANPPVRNIHAIDEEVVSVTVDMDFDGKPVQVQKIQKLKRNKKTGVVSLTNSYMVNSVPKSEKAFKEYMTELGFDFDKFLPCSHPDVLLSGINNKKERTALRNLLFEMASDITDAEVAKGDAELKEVCELLNDYSAEEIEAMQNNSLRVIRENYGREGEILRAKIESLESAKSDIDVAQCQAEVDDRNLKISEIERKIREQNQKMAHILELQSTLMDKKFALNEMQNQANAERNKSIQEISNRLFEMRLKINGLKGGIDRLKDNKESSELFLKENEIKCHRNIAAMAKRASLKFDESTAICPTCGQALRGDALENARKKWESEKDARTKQFETVIADQKAKIISFKGEIEEVSSKITDKNAELDALRDTYDSLNSELQAKQAEPEADVSGSEEYKKLAVEIEDINNEIMISGDINAEIASLEQTRAIVLEERDGFLAEIAKAQRNDEIQKQIDGLRKDQTNFEQKKADAEMILHQLKLLNMKKNNLLQESVNKNFNLINWKLWDVLKNGEYKDACIPMIGDKAFGESMNTGLETMAKIDAMNGIQKFFGLDYPIWLDNAEHLDKWSLEKLDTDHQLIVLTVTDDERLVIE